MKPATLSTSRLSLIGLLALTLTAVACDPGGGPSGPEACDETTECLAGDGCCPVGCDTLMDPDCPPTCGNGVIEPGETCEAACPVECDDHNACTADRLVGDPQACVAACENEPIQDCIDGDGCCPAGCDALRDDDCSATCGNGVLEPGETCEGACPASCQDADACTRDVLTGSAANCNSECSHEHIDWCSDGDGCCPEGCNSWTDADCQPVCGNGVVEPGETCEPSSGDCPQSPADCDDGQACTSDSIAGQAVSCSAVCEHAPIEACVDDDGCCPAGCDANQDDDCQPICGNGIDEPGETCDGDCPVVPSDCEDGLACTRAQVVGDPDTCRSACGQQIPIQSCVHGDGCCPDGCDQLTDVDCEPCPAGAHPCVQGCCGWEQSVAARAQVSFTTGVAIDTHGYVHMVYGGYGTSFHYAVLSPYGWTITNGPQSAGDCRHHVLALDGQGAPHVAWYNFSDHTLHYAHLDDSGWSNHAFDVGYLATDWRPIALVLGGSDQPIIAYRDNTDHSLRLTALAAAWFTTTIDDSSWIGASVDLARDPQGDLHVSYFDRSDGGVIYGFNNGSGWQLEQIGLLASGGDEVSLALGPDGQPRVAFHREDGLAILRRQGQAWQDDLVDACHDCHLNGLDLEIDPQGAAHLIYSHQESGRLYYARQVADGYWARFEVAIGVQAITRPDLVLDADGLPAIGMDRHDPDEVVLLRW